MTTTCVYCGDTATVNDHVVPKCQGGVLTQPSCQPCNASKGGRTPTEWVIAMWRRFLRSEGHHNHRFFLVLAEHSPLIDWAAVQEAKMDVVSEAIFATWWKWGAATADGNADANWPTSTDFRAFAVAVLDMLAADAVESTS